MALDYAWEKLYAAVLTLAEGSSPVQQRLADAYVSQLMRLTAADLPADMQDDFKLLSHELTKIAAVSGEGTAAASADRLGEQTARDLVERVVGLYEAVCRRLGPEE